MVVEWADPTRQRKENPDAKGVGAQADCWLMSVHACLSACQCQVVGPALAIHPWVHFILHQIYMSLPASGTTTFAWDCAHRSCVLVSMCMEEIFSLQFTE